MTGLRRNESKHKNARTARTTASKYERTYSTSSEEKQKELERAHIIQERITSEKDEKPKESYMNMRVLSTVYESMIHVLII
jgi:hypothetical protein